MKFNKFKKWVSIFAVLIFCFIMYSNDVKADVITEQSPTGDANTVYVAGNPDLYPIEYYDSDDKVYKGIIPELLRKVSDSIGISFTYISAGRENVQRNLVANKQVEMVTAISSHGENWNVEERCPILTIEKDGVESTYCIGFTDIASDELITTVSNAINAIPEEEKAGIMIAYAMENKQSNDKNGHLLTGLIIAGIIIAVLIIVLMLRRHKHKEEKKNDLVDALTGVGNDQYYVYVFDELISEQAKNLYNVAYIALDTDKYENMWGKDVVNDIQKYAATKLFSVTGTSEYISRVKNGVFTFVFQSENKSAADLRVKEIIEGLNLYMLDFNINWKDLFSAGVCHLVENPDCNAEMAYYRAKQGYLYAKEKRVHYFIGNETYFAESKKNKELRLRIDDAIRNDEFKVYMHLIIENKSGDVCGAELLSRWQTPDYGLLRPHEYIALLRDSGKIIEHDYNMFSKACLQLDRWKDTIYKNMFLTCNFTKNSVAESDFADKIKEIADKFTFSHEQLLIEITEDTFHEDSKTITNNIKKCADMGFKVAIDDIGTGFSSFADLYENEVDVVKIEKGFISTCDSKRKETILHDIITLAHNAGAKVVCEGVETEEQQNMIEETGCDMLQGFFYSCVLPFSEYERYLETKKIYAGNVLESEGKDK